MLEFVLRNFAQAKNMSESADLLLFVESICDLVEIISRFNATDFITSKIILHTYA